MLERTAVPRLHDTRMSFRSGMKTSPRYSYRGELAPVCRTRSGTRFCAGIM